jgi:antitoxin Phd
MHSWSVRDAKTRFDEFLDTCLAEGPQLITRHGAEVAVLVPVDEWRRLRPAVHRSLKQLLLAHQTRAELEFPARGKLRRRTPWIPQPSASAHSTTKRKGRL